MRPVPVVQMEEVLAQLSERGKLEWDLAATRAQLAKALAVPPESEPATIPAGNQLTTPEP